MSNFIRVNKSLGCALSSRIYPSSEQTLPCAHYEVQNLTKLQSALNTDTKDITEVII